MAKSPTIKRILKEASELASQPSPDYHAAPLESDLYEWHFTLRGPPAPSPFSGGLYHGRIILPPAYPLKPPSFRFLTPTGRFEVNREICLSISGHHEETWQPAWGIRTALVAIRSFMDTDAKGQLGGMDASEEVRRRFAERSRGWRCGGCGGKTNGEIMREQEEVVREQGVEGKGEEEEVPEELRLAYREDLGEKGDDASSTAKKTGGGEEEKESSSSSSTAAASAVPPPATAIQIARPIPPSAESPSVSAGAAQRQAPAQPRQDDDGIPSWIDKAIYGVVISIILLILKKYLL